MHAIHSERMRWMGLAGNIGAVVAVSVLVVNKKEHHAEEEADGAHCDVGDAQEGVFSAHPGDGAEDHSLSALKATNGIVVSDFQAVVSSGQCGCHVVLLLNNAVQLSEGGQGSGAHPHNEILVYEAVVFWVSVQLIDRLPPVDRFCCVNKHRSKIGVVSTRVSELHMFVRPPSDPLFDHRNLGFCSIGVNVKQVQRIIKHAVSNSSTWSYTLVIICAVWLTLFAWFLK